MAFARSSRFHFLYLIRNVIGGRSNHCLVQPDRMFALYVRRWRAITYTPSS
jgi:hypothetical protein